ncbi:MAG: hypothetical protein ACRELD_09605 [Longimicrobiales bacterium]
MSTRIWPLPFAVLVLGCSAQLAEPDVRATEDEPFAIRVGESARVFTGAGHVVIEFVAVSEDSRCPVDVDCVWSGDATVELRVRDASPDELALHTHLEPQAGVIDGFELRLLALEPEPNSERQIMPDEYLAQLLVTRR